MKLYNKLLLSLLLVPLVTVPSQGKSVTQAAENSLAKELGKFHDQYMSLRSDIIECKNKSDYRRFHIEEVYEKVNELKELINNQKTIIDPIIQFSSVNNLKDIEASISKLIKNIEQDIASIQKAKSGWLANSQGEIDGLESLQQNLRQLHSKYQDLFFIARQELQADSKKEESAESGLSAKGASAAVSSAQSSTGAIASSAQPGKYTVKDAQLALDYVNKHDITNADFWTHVSKKLDEMNIGETQKENIFQLIHIIITIKGNQNKITLGKKLDEAEQELSQSYQEDEELGDFYPIKDDNIRKIILDGIEEQLKSEEAKGKDQKKSVDDDFKKNREELQRKLVQLQTEEQESRSIIEQNKLEAEMAKMRAQLEQELKDIEMRKSDERTSDQQQDIEEELATLEQQSIDKPFMDKVVKNASSWITKLPKGEQVTQAAVRKLLEKDATDAQVLYVNGFLQAMKL